MARKLQCSTRYLFKLTLVAVIVIPYLTLLNEHVLKSDSASSNDNAIQQKLNEIINLSPEQRLIDPAVLLQTLKFMFREVDYDDPELVSFVRTLIRPPLNEKLNLTDATKKDFSQLRQSEKVDAILKGKQNGFYIEAGAFDGEFLSNTLFFELSRNWSGLLIEPIPSVYKELLQRHRKAYSINACIGNSKASIEKFSVLHVLSGSDNQMSVDHKKRINKEGLVNGEKRNSVAFIPCFPLATILKAINVNKVDYFSLDVEGGEMNILQSLDFSKLDIGVFTIESSANFFHRDAITKHLHENSYVLIEDDYNELYFCKNCNPYKN